ncbi:hypothetical protein PtB15_13B252 [Puccinia triticina]|nr:hypothetical protein PtB15_13B252 [Puccinia triticina]
MADSQAQKEWKRNVRSSFKEQLTLEAPPPPALPAAQEGWARDGPVEGPKLKWRSKKVTQKSYSAPGNYMAPSDRRRTSTARVSQPAKNKPGFELSGGGFHVVGLGSTGGFLMPGFHPTHGGGPMPSGGLHSSRMLTAGASAPSTYADPPLQPLFPLGPATPLLPFYPPGGWFHPPGLNFSPGSEASPASSVGVPPTPAKFPPTPHGWPGPPTGEFCEKSTAYYYYHHHHELYQPVPSQPPLPALHLHQQQAGDGLGGGTLPPGSAALSLQKSPLDGPPILDPSPQAATTTVQERYATDTQTSNTSAQGPFGPAIFQPIEPFDLQQQHPLLQRHDGEERLDHESKFVEIPQILHD